jgi:hypothetical protein
MHAPDFEHERLDLPGIIEDEQEAALAYDIAQHHGEEIKAYHLGHLRWRESKQRSPSAEQAKGIWLRARTCPEDAITKVRANSLNRKSA